MLPYRYLITVFQRFATGIGTSSEDPVITRCFSIPFVPHPQMYLHLDGEDDDEICLEDAEIHYFEKSNEFKCWLPPIKVQKDRTVERLKEIIEEWISRGWSVYLYGKLEGVLYK